MLLHSLSPVLIKLANASTHRRFGSSVIGGLDVVVGTLGLAPLGVSTTPGLGSGD